MIRLERIADALPAGFDTLREEAAGEGHSMLDTLGVDWESGKNRFDHDGEALFAAFLDDVLAGIGGLTLEPGLPKAMRMRRFYVRSMFRRSGVGRALAIALLRDVARGRTVTANAAAGSEAFWEALGFAPDRRDGRTHIRVNAGAADV
ncbi:MAG TPA: GNAT family N-acetyltransferase [Stellaceae bacterium]|nr:GNAT family N-acetyltransferase [Stellaceae bacterium]